MARASGARLRPHFKTHDSAVVAGWYREAGVDQITVSSIDMAVRFARLGWSDITIAFPANLRAHRRLRALAERVHLGLLADSVATVQGLSDALLHATDLWIEVDVGYGRSGVRWDDEDGLIALGAEVLRSRSLRLRGVLTHAGHTYQVRTLAEVQRIHAESMARITFAHRVLTESTGSHLEISVGDTPSCSAMDRIEGASELRPGNFVFYDIQQLTLGSCAETDLALMVACPIVGVYPERGEIVVHGGAVHLSKDSARLPGGGVCHGRIAKLATSPWSLWSPDSYVSAVSQEHGLVRCEPELLDSIAVGDLLLIVPAHACLAANSVRRTVLI